MLTNLDYDLEWLLKFIDIPAPANLYVKNLKSQDDLPDEDPQAEARAEEEEYRKKHVMDALKDYMEGAEEELKEEAVK